MSIKPRDASELRQAVEWALANATTLDVRGGRESALGHYRAAAALGEPDAHYFLARSAAVETKLVEGDARLRLREAADGGYDLLVLDAFSSDAIQVHLITREALKLYLRKLAPGGLLAFHISNRYLDLEPVLGNLAQELRLVALGCDDMSLTEAEFATGREQSHWVVMARTAEGLAGFQRRTRWSPLETNPRVGVWMDDFSSPVKVWQR